MSVLNLLCPICTDIFRNVEDIYSTSCGHVFHLRCLREWQNRSSSCPQCYEYSPTTHKLNLSFDESARASVPELKDSLENACKEIHELKRRLYDRNIVSVHDRVQSDKEIEELKKLVANLKNKIVCLEGGNSKLRQQIVSLTQEISNLEAHSERTVAELNKEIVDLKKDLENITTEFAIEVSKNVHHSAQQDQQMNAPSAPDQIDLYKDRIEVLEQTLKHISAEFEKEIITSTQLKIDKMKLQNYIDCIKSNSASSAELENAISVSNTNDVPEPSVTSASTAENQGSKQCDLKKQSTVFAPSSDVLRTREKTRQNDISTTNTIIIQNYPSLHLENPLEKTLLHLAKNMDIILNKDDIDRVNIMGGSSRTRGDRISIFVRFKTKDMKMTFLGKKNSLSRCSTTFLRVVQVKEYFDQRIHDVFLYAKKRLLDNGYSNIFLSNNEIMAKKNISDTMMIRIHTCQEVDELLNNQEHKSK